MNLPELLVTPRVLLVDDEPEQLELGARVEMFVEASPQKKHQPECDCDGICYCSQR
jgi:hypothetical protein